MKLHTLQKVKSDNKQITFLINTAPLNHIFDTLITLITSNKQDQTDQSSWWAY